MLSRYLMVATLFVALFAPSYAYAANEGDTMTTRVTTCNYGADTCTTTITDMRFSDGQWVIVSVRTISTPNPRNPRER
jgi:hypothetical protein